MTGTYHLVSTQLRIGFKLVCPTHLVGQSKLCLPMPPRLPPVVACWGTTVAGSSPVDTSEKPTPATQATGLKGKSPSVQDGLGTTKKPAANTAARGRKRTTMDQPAPQAKPKGRPKTKKPDAQTNATDQPQAKATAKAPEATAKAVRPKPKATSKPTATAKPQVHVPKSPLDEGDIDSDSDSAYTVAAVAEESEGAVVCGLEQHMWDELVGVGEMPSEPAVPAPASAAPLDPDLGPVTCTHDVMRWPTSNIKRMQNPTAALDTVCQAISATDSLASCFSGVSADHVSLNMAIAQWERMRASTTPSSSTIRRPRYIAAVDKDVECQNELCCLPHGPANIFSDMKDFGTDELLEKLGMEKEPYCADRIAALCTEPGAVKTRAKCIKTNKECTFDRPDGLIAGIPCTDWTLWGKGRRLEGPTACVTMITLAFFCLILPFWIIIENVPTFDEDVVRRYCGRYYNIEAVVLDNLDFGLTVRRVRKYVLLTLKTAMTLTRPLTDLTPTFGRKRAPQYNWRSILSASKAELWSEILWSQRRTPGEKSQEDTSREPTETDFLDALLETERDRVNGYLEQHDVSECVLSLGQNPEFAKCASGTDVLHTLVRSVHIQWMPSMGRWMTCREMLLAQSFPTTNAALASASGLESSDSVSVLPPLCSFNVSRPGVGLPSRHRTAMAHQAGNTMCTNVCGSVLTWLFLHVKKAHVQNVPSSVSSIASPSCGMSLFGSLRSAATQIRASPGSSCTSQTLNRSTSSQSLGMELQEVRALPTFYNAFRAARMKALGRSEEL